MRDLCVLFHLARPRRTDKLILLSMSYIVHLCNIKCIIMIFGLFNIRSFQNANAAFSAFEERGLFGKRFSSKLSKIDPIGQLSEWLVLVRLLSTLEHAGPGDLTVRANRKLAHTMIFDYEEFCINKDDSGYEISTSTEFDRMADGILGIQKVPMAWALYEDANDAFWQMVSEYRMNVPEDTFEKEIMGIYNENCSNYLDPDILCKGTWMAVCDTMAPWPFDELDSDEESPSFTFSFFQDNHVCLSGWALGAIQLSNAKLNRRTGEIVFNNIVLGRVVSLEKNEDRSEELTVEMFYGRDGDCPEVFFEYGKETPTEYLKKADDGSYSIFLCRRISRQ